MNGDRLVLSRVVRDASRWGLRSDSTDLNSLLTGEDPIDVVQALVGADWCRDWRAGQVVVLEIRVSGGTVVYPDIQGNKEEGQRGSRVPTIAVISVTELVGAVDTRAVTAVSQLIEVVESFMLLGRELSEKEFSLVGEALELQKERSCGLSCSIHDAPTSALICSQ